MNIKDFYGNTNAYSLDTIFPDQDRPSTFGELHYLSNVDSIDPKKIWYVPEYFSGSDYSGSLINRSNHDIVLDLNIPNVYEIHGIHCSYGLAIRGDVDNEELISILKGLEDYAIVDEMFHSEIEEDAKYEAWSNWVEKEFIKLLTVKFENEYDEEELIEKLEKSENLYGFYNDHCVEWINEYQDMWSNVERTVKKISFEKLEAFLNE